MPSDYQLGGLKVNMASEFKINGSSLDGVAINEISKKFGCW